MTPGAQWCPLITEAWQHTQPYTVTMQIQWYGCGDNLHVRIHTLPAETCWPVRTHRGGSSSETHTGPFERGGMDFGAHRITSDITTAPVWWHTQFDNSNMITHTERIIKMTTFTLWQTKYSFIHTVYGIRNRDTFCDNSNTLIHRRGWDTLTECGTSEDKAEIK